MITGKFLYTLIAIFLAILAFCNFENISSFGTVPIIEGWWGGQSFTTRNMYSTVNSRGNDVALPLSYVNPGTFGSNKFVSTPSFQAILAPRMSGQLQYGANIRYNMPDRKNMAVPCDPLTFGSMKEQENFLSTRTGAFKPNQINQVNHQVNRQNRVKENYGCGTGQCDTGAPSCGKGGYGIGKEIDNDGTYAVPPDYHNGNWKELRDSLAPSDIITNDAMPIGTLNSIDGSGDPEQTVVLSHIMPSNTRAGSRLYAQSDFFRGDLFINPDCQPQGWFKVTPNIARDVNPGALMAMGGLGDTALQTISAINAASGSTALSGIDITNLPKYNPNMALQSLGETTALNSDVMITSFP